MHGSLSQAGVTGGQALDVPHAPLVPRADCSCQSTWEHPGLGRKWPPTSLLMSCCPEVKMVFNSGQPRGVRSGESEAPGSPRAGCWTP